MRPIRKSNKDPFSSKEDREELRKMFSMHCTKAWEILKILYPSTMYNSLGDKMKPENVEFKRRNQISD